MLDTDTKRRIDTARDILVGKVPDPKSQVEQITIALIYKFMDDMDAEAEELGGKRKFFTDEFARYGWAKLMRSGLGGKETLDLYGDGISKMPENPGIPPLFRDIFKNAYLPYRDPETLKAFLKIIDEFTYDHSERLGDAFEYLLSVLGSQGDAGQFRTPRHIIDFIVSIVDPKKDESVLDPACGTAGFLISSYKHILRANTDEKSVCKLTPDDRGLLAKNFKGYDISPDMVRLSLVNLYLHGFTDPHIYEYDTLTSEERWNEFADVILANPPFMSPKGGIKPHRRFSIQAKRSEVLFVDYMAEHLTPKGRAGIIVPEGVIFQSQDAYAALRKMLVETSLVAVVSLPAGMFNPYSGVKTSVLILDKWLAKQAQTIAFFKVENDGFGLGAQRRAIEKNDLPQVQVELTGYLQALRKSQTMDDLKPTCGLIVTKEKIAANADYNLSAERYREGAKPTGSYPWSKLESLIETITPPFKIQKTAFGTRGQFPIIDQSQDNIAGWTDDDTVLVRPSKPLVIFGDHTCAVKLVETPFAQGADGIKILRTVESLDPRFLFQILRAKPLESAGYQRHYSLLKEMKIPLPPLEVQRGVVAEIEGYEKIIDGARQVLGNYRPHIPIHPEWPVVELAEVIEDKPKNGYSGKPVDRITDLKVLTLSATTSGTLDLTKFKYLDEEIPINAPCRCRKGDIYLQRGNTAELVGTAALFDVDEPNYIYPDLMIRVRAKESKIISHYLLITLQSRPVRDFLTRNAVGAAGSMPKINQGIVERVPIPLPPPATQQQIIAEIEAEKKLVAANRELVERFEKKIQATLARIWGENEQPAEEM